jgi:hypothetical protein
MIRLFHPIMLFLFVVLFTSFAKAQQNGKIVLVQDDRIPALVEKHIYLNQGGKQLDGYRVQIFFDSGTNSKTRASNKKSQFELNCRGVAAYLTFESPNYKIRVGDFRTRMDAEGFKAKIIGMFPDAFVVKDKINYPVLESDNPGNN